MLRAKRWFALALVLEGGGALAAEPDALGVHPLVVIDVDAPEQVAALEAAFEEAIAQQKVRTIDGATIRGAGSCAAAADATACLRELAKKLRARAVMMVTVRLWPVMVKGQITPVGGETVTVPWKQVTPKSDAERLEVARRELVSLTKELLQAEDEALLVPLVSNEQAVAERAAPASEQQTSASVGPPTPMPTGVAVAHEPSGNWRRPAAYLSAAVGAAALGGATWWHFQSGKAGAELDELKQNKPFLTRDEQTVALALTQKRDSYAASRNVALGVGVLGLVAGGILYLSSEGHEANAAPAALGVAAGPGAIAVRGRF